MIERFIPLYGFLSWDGLGYTYAETMVRKIYDVFDKAEIIACAEDAHPRTMGSFCWSLELRKGKSDEALQSVPSGLEEVITDLDRDVFKLDITTALNDFMQNLDDEEIGFVAIKRNWRNFKDTAPHDIRPMGIRIEVQSSGETTNE